jgi:hypothetical protein
VRVKPECELVKIIKMVTLQRFGAPTFLLFLFHCTLRVGTYDVSILSSN